MHDEKVVTIFSAPNYCYRCANLGAYMEVDEKMHYNYITFDPSPNQTEKIT